MIFQPRNNNIFNDIFAKKIIIFLMIFLHQISDNYHYFLAEISLKISLIFGRNIIIFSKKINDRKKSPKY